MVFSGLTSARICSSISKLGLQKDTIKGFAAVKLLATLSQLATVSADKGLDLISDHTQIAMDRDINLKIDALKALFALIVLRTADAHKTSSSMAADVSNALSAFGVDQNQCQPGWGLALGLAPGRAP